MSEENKFEQENEDIASEVPEAYFDPPNDEENAPFTNSKETDDELKSPRKHKIIKVSPGEYVLSMVAAILATAILSCLLSFAICSNNYRTQLAGIYNELQTTTNTENDDDDDSSATSLLSEKTVIDFLLTQYFYEDVDLDKLTEESLRAYLAATGDIYAAYYTQEEVEANYQEDSGKMQGIGVNIINSKITIGNYEYAVLKVTNVMKNSPAQENGIRAGDLIFSVGTQDKKKLVDELGYDDALTQLKGTSGTVVDFSLLRKVDDKYEEMFFSLTRRDVITDSVYYRVLDGDSKIGVVRILDFELNTPTQFESAIESLKTQGCEKFVIDVRYNPGGYLISIAAILSYFLDEGDVYIRTENKSGNINEKKVQVVDDYDGDYEPCNVSKEDIGKYKNLNMVVLCNEYTASAAELFTATFRDYGLGKIVGTTTFGKGKMQTTYSLEMFGLEGAVKFTTHMYYSAKSEGYDGIGIKPDEGCDVPLSDEAMQYSIYDLPDNLDNQLQEAIQHFK